MFWNKDILLIIKLQRYCRVTFHLRASPSILMNIISANMRLGENVNVTEPTENHKILKVKEMDFPFQNFFLEEMLCFLH